MDFRVYSLSSVGKDRGGGVDLRNRVWGLRDVEKPTLVARGGVYLLQRQTTRVGKDLGKVWCAVLAFAFRVSGM